MRRLTFALALLALPAFGQQASTTLKNIDATWIAPTTSLPVCPATTPTSCVVGYIETLTDPTGGANTVKVPWGTLTGHFAPGSFLLCGDWPVSIVTDYYDDKGVEQKSTTPLTGTATVSCPFVAPTSPKGPVTLKVS